MDHSISPIKKAVAALCAGALCLSMMPLLSACSSGGSASSSSSSSSSATQADMRTFTDSAGREVQVPKNITAVAVSGPLGQQTLLTIAPEKMVGLSNKLTADQAKFIPSVNADLPVYGQLYGGKGDINKEALASANPQVIIDVGEAKNSIVQDMDDLQNQLGIPCVHIEATLEGYADAYTMLGDLLGVQDKAAKLSDYCKTTYSDINTKMATIPDDQKVKVAYCLGDSGLNVLGKGSFHATVLDMIADNVAVIDGVSSSGSGNEISMEQLASWNPQMIIFAPDSVYDTAAGDPTWQGLTAISTGNFYEVPDVPYNWMGSPPSVNRYLGMQWFANLCYPQTFNYDMYDKAKEYYSLFYNYDLTQDDYAAIAANAVKK